MSALYLSGFTPRNTPRIWDRNSIGSGDAKHILARYHFYQVGGSEPVGSVAWFDTRGVLRMLVCDMDDGRRITLRLNKGDWKVEIIPEGALAA